MRKMGWKEGEGLGKNKEGNKEPILVDFKTDRKGKILFFFFVECLLYLFKHLGFHYCYKFINSSDVSDPELGALRIVQS